jgi:hypothetical protein
MSHACVGMPGKRRPLVAAPHRRFSENGFSSGKLNPENHRCHPTFSAGRTTTCQFCLYNSTTSLVNWAIYGLFSDTKTLGAMPLGVVSGHPALSDGNMPTARGTSPQRRKREKVRIASVFLARAAVWRLLAPPLQLVGTSLKPSSPTYCGSPA